MSRIFSLILYYLVLIPISILPFSVLHFISGFLYFVLFYITGYRKKVVMTNLRNSFPEKSDKELDVIAKKFYRHLCDVLLESQKIFTLSHKQLIKHIQCINPDVVNQYYAQGKNVILAVGHMNSWELMLTAFNTFIDHRAVVIYKPLSNSYLDKKMVSARSKEGTLMLPVKEVKSFFTSPSKELFAMVFAIDQSPPVPGKSYWMKFLHQDTAVLFGTEHYAKSFNLPVIYSRLNKIKRGYYHLEFVPVTDDSANTIYGEITEKVTHLLEQDILSNPASWLWSHKRWKHKK
ncbi:MAG: lysophospholipid acyltransferase family protein [Saprospiraceae bacterium]